MWFQSVNIEAKHLKHNKLFSITAEKNAGEISVVSCYNVHDSSVNQEQLMPVID